MKPSPDAEGRVRRRDPGLGIKEGESYSLTAATPPAVAYDGDELDEEGPAVTAFDWQSGGAGSEEDGRGRNHVVRAGDYTGSLQGSKVDAVHYDGDELEGDESERTYVAEEAGTLEKNDWRQTHGDMFTQGKYVAERGAVGFHNTQDPISEDETSMPLGRKTFGMGVLHDEAEDEQHYYIEDHEDGTLRADPGRTDKQPLVVEDEDVALSVGTAHHHDPSRTQYVVEDEAATLKAQRGKDGGGIGPEETLVTESVGGDVAHSLTSEGFDASEDGTGRGTPIVTAPNEAATLSVGSHPNSNAPGRRREDDDNLVVQEDEAVGVAQNQRGELREMEVSPSLGGGGGKPGEGYPAARIGQVVRRLTPTECERLQGFPDGWTLLADEDVTPDGPRYAALGDAVTVPVSAWIFRRLVRKFLLLAD